jgi:hypothetical protein
MNKFIQLVAVRAEDKDYDTLFALDSDGVVWRQMYWHDKEKNEGRTVWHREPFYKHPESV